MIEITEVPTSKLRVGSEIDDQVFVRFIVDRGDVYEVTLESPKYGRSFITAEEDEVWLVADVESMSIDRLEQHISDYLDVFGAEPDWDHVYELSATLGQKLIAEGA